LHFAALELEMRAYDFDHLDDFFRPADVGMSVDDFRRQFHWLTEYGDTNDPYYSRSELFGDG
jgi:hypothetical protein